MDMLLSMFKALADKNRLRIISALLQHEELCACQLTELLGVSGATASRHLAQLQNAGLIVGRKDGRWVYFRMNETLPNDLPIGWLEEKIFESDIFTQDKVQLEAILAENPETICQRQRS